MDVSNTTPLKSFSDILSPELITSSAKSESTPFPSHSRESSLDRLRRVVRSTALPKMQGVVQNVIGRSGTTRVLKGNNSKDDTSSMMTEKSLLADDTKSFVSEKDRIL